MIKTGLWEGLGARSGIYTSSVALQMSVYIYICRGFKGKGCFITAVGEGREAA